ncbi:MAG: NAD(P)/FAD-dependent oxidoreductase [Chitinophagaceae bacterium]|nr:NAD(P)/FAD-dependent oxidoreductase [Chitinophagaceae bacterium]
MNKKKLIVIGGGAAGFFCAVNAARLNPQLEVIILEKSNKLLSKVKVSGGGRCNVTHACYSIAEMIKRYPRGAAFLKKAFHHFFTNDTIAWFAERGVTLKTEADGRMFPVTDSSQTIIDCLMKEANKYNVEIRMNKEVKQLAVGSGQLTGAKPFEIQFADDSILYADFVCIASGGYPKIMQYGWLKRSDHAVEEPVPSLFTFNMPGNSITALMGVVVENTQVKIVGTKLSESGPLLITHWGMSGPAVLKLSAWGARELAKADYGFSILVNWIPDFNENTLRDKMQQLRFELAAQKIINRNPFVLPNRLWEYLLVQSGVHPDLRWADLPAKEQNKLIKNLCAQEFAVKGKTTFKEEFVTAGGIELNEIDFNTMQSKKHSGLFFAGEIINVDGITGGYNFQNAWTTGWIAAKAIATFKSLIV